MNLYIGRYKTDKEIAGLYYGRNILWLCNNLDDVVNFNCVEIFRIAGYGGSFGIWNDGSKENSKEWEPTEIVNNLNEEENGSLLKFSKYIDEEIKSKNTRKKWFDLEYIDPFYPIHVTLRKNTDFWFSLSDQKILKIIRTTCDEIGYKFNSHDTSHLKGKIYSNYKDLLINKFNELREI